MHGLKTDESCTLIRFWEFPMKHKHGKHSVIESVCSSAVPYISAYLVNICCSYCSHSLHISDYQRIWHGDDDSDSINPEQNENIEEDSQSKHQTEAWHQGDNLELQQGVWFCKFWQQIERGAGPHDGDYAWLRSLWICHELASGPWQKYRQKCDTGQNKKRSAVADVRKAIFYLAGKILCPHWKLFLQFLKKGWFHDKNLHQDPTPGHLWHPPWNGKGPENPENQDPDGEINVQKIRGGWGRASTVSCEYFSIEEE